jgi:hypothetical protein
MENNKQYAMSKVIKYMTKLKSNINAQQKYVYSKKLDQWVNVMVGGSVEDQIFYLLNEGAYSDFQKVYHALIRELNVMNINKKNQGYKNNIVQLVKLLFYLYLRDSVYTSQDIIYDTEQGKNTFLVGLTNYLQTNHYGADISFSTSFQSIISSSIEYYKTLGSVPINVNSLLRNFNARNNVSLSNRRGSISRSPAMNPVMSRAMSPPISPPISPAMSPIRRGSISTINDVHHRKFEKVYDNAKYRSNLICNPDTHKSLNFQQQIECNYSKYYDVIHFLNANKNGNGNGNILQEDFNEYLRFLVYHYNMVEQIVGSNGKIETITPRDFLYLILDYDLDEQSNLIRIQNFNRPRTLSRINSRNMNPIDLYHIYMGYSHV